MPITLLNFIEQIEVDYKIDGDPNFPKTRLTLFINQASRFVQMQLNGLGMERWEKKSSFTTPVAITNGSLIAGQVYTIITAGTGDFSNLAQVITGTINTNGCVFQAILTAAPNSWGGATLNTAGLTADSFMSSTGNVQTIPMFYTPSLAESPNALRFAETYDGTSWNQAKEISEQSVQNYLSNSIMTPTGKDSIFWRSDNTIYFLPYTLTTVVLHYYKVVTDLANDADVSEIPAEFMEYVIERVGVEIEFIQKKIQDKEAAITEITNAIANAYQKFLTMDGQEKANEEVKLQ